MAGYSDMNTRAPHIDKVLSRGDVIKETVTPHAIGDAELMHILDNMVKQPARLPSRAELGVMVGLVVAAGPSTFSQIYLWLLEDVKAELSESLVRDAFATLTGNGYIEAVQKVSSKRGPKTSVYVITEAGRECLSTVSQAPIQAKA